MRVLIITYYWPPAGGPGVQRWLKFTKYLPEFGIEPVVLTVNPNKATYPLRDDSLLKEVHDKVEVHYTNTFEPFGAYQKTTGRKEVPFSGFANETDKPGPRQKLAKFIRGNFFLPDARKGWNKYALAEAKKLLAKEEFAAIITTGPPHSTHLIGRELKKRFEVNWIADFRDPWTDIYYYNDLYPTKLAKKIDAGMELSVLEQANKVTTVSQDMVRILAEKLKKRNLEKFLVIPNGFDEQDFKSKPISKNDVFTITYAGTLTHKYRPQTFLNVVESVAENGEKIKLVFAGKQDEVVQKQLAELKNVNVELPGYLSHDEALQLVKETDVLLLAIPDLPDNKGILTGKLFEYLAAKKPVLCLGPIDGDAAQMLEKANAGVVCQYDDATSIELNLKKMLTDFQAEKKPAFNAGFISTFSRRALAQQLSELIQDFQ